MYDSPDQFTEIMPTSGFFQYTVFSKTLNMHCSIQFELDFHLLATKVILKNVHSYYQLHFTWLCSMRQLERPGIPLLLHVAQLLHRTCLLVWSVTWINQVKWQSNDRHQVQWLIQVTFIPCFRNRFCEEAEVGCWSSTSHCSAIFFFLLNEFCNSPNLSFCVCKVRN